MLYRVEYRLTPADLTRLRQQGYTGTKQPGDWSEAHAFRNLPQAKIAEARLRKRGYEVRIGGTKPC